MRYEAAVTCECGCILSETGKEPPEDRRPCPDCGSLVRVIRRTFESEVTFSDGIGVKLRHEGSSKIAQEHFAGTVMSAEGTLVELRTLKDREADRYQEIVTGPDGVVIHHDEGPLSSHVGHGSDRPDLRQRRDEARRAKAQERAARKARRDAQWPRANRG